uniref:ZP domain-containing protein n=1 Tax=Globodera pallida TaxID=36090 RepID=A0A183C7U2_GLOPA
MAVPYRIIFLIFLTVLPFVTIAYPSSDADNDATIYVYFKGVVQGRRENEVVVDIFCGQIGRNIYFYTGARGQFEFPIDEQFLRYFRGCTAEGITIGFYKKATNEVS